MNSFDEFFQAATGHPPFRWQCRLHERFARGEVPIRCDIPTGLGKTSVIPVWAFALAHQMRSESANQRLPRRLVYIVDRRTVVDQATEQVEALLAKFRQWAASEECPELHSLARAFLEASCEAGGEPFTVSTLRGQHADNRRWLEDPARPAVIVGTVDMLGSRLLFSGYGGLGRYSRSLHAGLLAQDALIVVDEAHLCPSFLESLHAIARHVNRWRLIRPLHVMLLSATQPPAAGGAPPSAGPNGEVFSLDPGEDRKDEEVAQRLDAPKRLKFVNPSAEADQKLEDAYANTMAREAVALAGTNSAVVVFANTVERVNLVVTALKSMPLQVPEERIVTLTGEMRGKERDQLVKQPVFARFCKRRRDRGQLEKPIFLVTTAAGEVGINFDADHAVCDVVPIERMIQRLGRVNRFGDGLAQVAIVLPLTLTEMPRHARELRTVLSRLPQAKDKERKKLEKQLANLEEVLSRFGLAATRLLLRLPKPSDDIGLPLKSMRDASPAQLHTLTKHPQRLQQAFSPVPPCPPLDEPRLDDWSLTSLNGREFPRPQVGYWLRGITPDDSPHTWLAWRADLDFAAGPDDAARMAATLPLAPAELAQVRTHRAAALLEKLRKRCPDACIAVLSPGGDWTGRLLRDLPEKDNDLARELVSATVILPAHVGGLKGGVIEDSKEPVPDAVDSARFRRVVLRPTEDGWEATELSETAAGHQSIVYRSLAEARRQLLKALRPSVKFLHLSGADTESALDADEPPEPRSVRVAYFVVRSDGADLPDAEDLASLQRRNLPLQDHLDQAAEVARRLCAKLELPNDLADAVVQACARHDTGKRLPQWQKAIGNAGQVPLAKSVESEFNYDATRGFRHEFLSLLEAAEDSALAQHPHRDLILHLIAAHHGHARPGFSPEAYGILPLHTRCSEAAHEAALRFARLQRKVGWWQLAYLEALVKCADAIASREADTATP
jgi:CRISPR-associated endonuclease/helicase Cas3